MTQPRPNPNPDGSLFEEMGEIADELRQIQTDLGARPYRVFAVVLKYSGEVGRGEPVVVVEKELLPTPLVRLRGIRQELKSGGKTDRGYTEISEISPQYSEEQLQRSFHVKPLTEAEEAFYEVREDARGGRAPVRRRFALRSVPERDVDNFQWVIRVSAQDSNRSQSGEPNKPKRVWRR